MFAKRHECVAGLEKQERLLSPRITAPLARGPRSRWYGDDSFHSRAGKRSRAGLAPSPFSLDDAKSLRQRTGARTPAETSSDEDDQGDRSSKRRSRAEKLSPVFSPVEPHELSREVMGNISPLSIGSDERKYTFPMERPVTTFLTPDAVVGVVAWASCQQTPAAQEPTHQYCMLCSFLFSQMPANAQVVRPNPEGCGHAFCKGCYDAASSAVTVVRPRSPACPECKRLGATEAREQNPTALAVLTSSAQAPQEGADFESLGVAKYSAAFDAAQLTAAALVELVEGSARGLMDDAVAVLHMELDVDVEACEWIYEQVIARRLQETSQRLRGDRW